MRKIIVEAEVALDGVIGGENPDFWTQVFKYHGEDVLGYLKHLLFTPDALLMGRKTYELFAQVWPSRNGEEADRINSMLSSTLLRASDIGDEKFLPVRRREILAIR